MGVSYAMARHYRITIIDKWDIRNGLAIGDIGEAELIGTYYGYFKFKRAGVSETSMHYMEMKQMELID